MNLFCWATNNFVICSVSPQWKCWDTIKHFSLFSTKQKQNKCTGGKQLRLKPVNKLEQNVLGLVILIHPHVLNSPCGRQPQWEMKLLFCSLPNTKGEQRWSTNTAIVFVFVSTCRAWMWISVCVYHFARSVCIWSPHLQTRARCHMQPY